MIAWGWVCALPLLLGLQTPTQPEDARAVVLRTMDAYSKAATYQGEWAYTTANGPSMRRMAIEVKKKGNTMLLFRLAPPPSAASGGPTKPSDLPEVLIVVDGKTAWFENTTGNTYFKVQLPRDGKVSPFMFFPIVPSMGAVTRTADVQIDGAATVVLQAPRQDGGITRLYIDSATARLRKIEAETVSVSARSISTLTVVKETMDAPLADSIFQYKPRKGAAERPAPADATLLFRPVEKPLQGTPAP